MTGWRLGFAVGRPELIGALTRVKSYVDTGPFLAVQKAGAAALDHARGAGRSRSGPSSSGGATPPCAALREAGFVLESPEGGDVPLGGAAAQGLPSAAFARRALEETGVVVLPGSAFGPAGEGFFRIALTVGADRLREAAGRLGRTLEATRRGELATTA